jgi:hypothetical protein
MFYERFMKISNIKLIMDRLLLMAYAYDYEVLFYGLASDGEYDKLSKKLYETRHEKTGHKEIDRIFEEEFTPNSGMWIHSMSPSLQEDIESFCHKLTPNTGN